MGVDRGDRIERLWDVDHECRQRWEHNPGMPYLVARVAVGVLEDGTGRWYVEGIGQDVEGTRAYPTEAQARQVAANLMGRRGDGWTEVPCYPTEEDLRQRGYIQGADGRWTRPED